MQGHLEYKFAMKWRELAIRQEHETDVLKRKFAEERNVLLAAQKESLGQEDAMRKYESGFF